MNMLNLGSQCITLTNKRPTNSQI